MALNKAWPLVGLVFCTWAVSLGGLAALQSSCVDTDTTVAKGTGQMRGVRGVSADILDCTKVFRYYWFIISYEVVCIFGLAYALSVGIYGKTRLAFLAMFAVAVCMYSRDATANIASLLYMQTADTSLAVENIAYYEDGQPVHRGRTLTAGSIMTAVADLLIVFVLGLEDSEEKAEAAAEP